MSVQVLMLQTQETCGVPQKLPENLTIPSLMEDGVIALRAVLEQVSNHFSIKVRSSNKLIPIFDYII